MHLAADTTEQKSLNTEKIVKSETIILKRLVEIYGWTWSYRVNGGQQNNFYAPLSGVCSVLNVHPFIQNITKEMSLKLHRGGIRYLPMYSTSDY